MIELEPTFWNDQVDPCFRMKFRLLMSQNALAGERWQKTQEIELWRKCGMDRLIETAKEAGIPTEGFCEIKHYSYRGRSRKKTMTGERLKEYFFTEEIIMICRVWKSDETEMDIDNIHLKAVIDGFVDGRLMPNDTTKYLRGVFRWYEGLDRSVGLSKDQADARRRIRNERKLAGLNRSIPPPPNKMIYIDCYRINRLVEKKIDLFSLIGFPRLTL